MATSLTCAEFLEWTLQELKYYLAMRALSQEGSKLDLAARAMVAFEKQMPVRQDLDALEKELRSTYIKMLEKHTITDPIKIPEKDWVDNVSIWPRVDLGKVFAYVIEKKAFEMEYIGQYKARKAYSYFLSGFVHKISAHEISEDKVLLKGKVTPSQKLRENPKMAWVLCSKNGDVLCGYCTCTAGFAECCNHVVAILYKVEFANSKGMIDPACTDVACAWNQSTQKDVQFSRIKDVQIKKHDITKRNKKRLIQTDFKHTFDPRPVEFRGKEDERGEVFLSKLREEQPAAAVLKCVEPPKTHACPDPLPVIAEEIIRKHAEQSEQELVKFFSEELSFNEEQLQQLERATRAQAGSVFWKEQRIGCITATKIKDVSTKIEKIGKSRGKKVAITPLLVRIFEEKDIGTVPAIQYGRQHEEQARKKFAETIVKKHQNGKLLDCGLLASKTFPFIRATPDNIFLCKCCEGGRVPVEYKCPYKLRDKCVSEAHSELDFLEETEGRIRLKRSHKYYSQVITQMALLDAKHAFFVVWTPAGEPFIEKIGFDLEHWSLLERNAVIFFKGHVLRVLLKKKVLYFCPICDKACLEEGEFDCAGENSIECSSCQLWCHWACANLKRKPKGDYICPICIELNTADEIDIFN